MAPGVAAAPANEDNGPPRLHLFGQRLTAKALADLSGGGEGLGWFFNEDELMCPDDHVEHGTISEVRHEASREVATSLRDALGDAILPASESDTIGRVVVISPCDPDGDIREQCLRALAIKPEAWEFANVTPKQYAQCMAKGFCYSADPEVDDPVDEKIVAATAVLVQQLGNHFEFNFSDEAVTAPVIYGGRHAESGDIIGILSMRVWT